MSFLAWPDAEGPENREDLLVAYKGAMWQETLVDLGTLVRGQLASCRRRKAVFSAFVEMAQNLQKQSAVREQFEQSNIGVGLIVVREIGNQIMVHTAFPIERKKAASLEKFCGRLASLDETGLRCLLRARRKNAARGHDPALGLICIARQANEPMEFVFQDGGDDRQLFSLTVRIKKGGST